MGVTRRGILPNPFFERGKELHSSLCAKLQKLILNRINVIAVLKLQNL